MQNWVNLPKLKTSVWCFAKTWPDEATSCIFSYDLDNANREHCMTKSCQTEGRKNNNYYKFFGVPVAGFLLSLAFSPTALCGKDDSDESTLKKVTKPPFLRARSSKAAKGKLKTQAARAETCKRRLFVDEEENQPVPILPEPHVLRERIQPELVRLYFKIELV